MKRRTDDENMRIAMAVHLTNGMMAADSNDPGRIEKYSSAEFRATRSRLAFDMVDSLLTEFERR